MQAHVDLVIEFQIDQRVAPIVADKIARAGIPLIAVEIFLPHATYFGIDDYRVGFVAGEFLGQHAKKAWKGNAKKRKEPWYEVEITGAFEGVRRALPDVPLERFVRVDARGSSDKSYKLTIEFLRRHPKDRGILIAAADDKSALGALRAVKQIECEKHVAIVGQDCTPDVMDEMKIVGTPLVASVSHEVHTYGPRLMQLGLALLRGQHIAPYHYVDHKLVTAEALVAQPSDTPFIPLSSLRRETLRSPKHFRRPRSADERLKRGFAAQGD